MYPPKVTVLLNRVTVRSVKLSRTVFFISVSYVYINYVLHNYWADASHFWIASF